MWFILAIVSGVLFTLSSLTTRHVLKSGKDAWAFSFYFSFIGMLVSAPFLLYEWFVQDIRPFPRLDSASGQTAWSLILLVGLLIVLHNFLSFRARNYIEASIDGTITKFRLIWILALGVLLLPETPNLLTVLGTLLTFASGIILISKFKMPKSLAGMALSFAATFIFALNVVLYKFLFEDFSVSALTFMIFLIPTITNFVLMPRAVAKLTKLLQESRTPLLLACFFGATANLAMNAALETGEVTKVPVVIEAFLILLLAGEYFILRERKHLVAKLLAVLGATLGAILIRLA